MALSDVLFETPDGQPAQGWVAQRLADFELLLGFVITCFVGLIGVGLSGFVFVVWEWWFGAFHIPLGQRVVLTVAWGVATGCEIASVHWMGRIWPRTAYPRPVGLAMAQRWRGAIWGVCKAAWWLAHAVAVVATVDWIIDQYQLFRPTTAEVAMTYGMKFALLFGGAYASTGFVLLGVGALWRRERALRMLWQLRVPLDIAVAAALVLLGRGM
jgi:hypothetical protein